ncbi:hypothetical protein NKI36_08195 [Mesorhizobium caraganae]|uniref:Uncharacterized protein n=1 Tax=Mesorhizobium caraganae TaxID=483206 RepID=A0ABV1YWB0_9HYPH
MDDLEKTFLIHYTRQAVIHYMRQGSQGSSRALMRELEKRDTATLFDLNEYTVKEAVLRRVAFLMLISAVVMYFVGETPRSDPTASLLTASICAVALVFLYLNAFVPIVLLAVCVSLLAICWMDYNTFVLATLFSALYAVYFFARLRAR